jgi:L-alanine-DL-glutamate epimerase-like enolase superfamily enzyme
MARPSRRLTVRSESWPIRGLFTISRGSRRSAEVIVVEIAADGHRGWAECVPYARYGETHDSVTAQIEQVSDLVESGGDRTALADALPAGAARNAVDCALWDLEAKTTGLPVARLADLAEPAPVTTAFTISLDTPAKMASAAAEAAGRPLLKIKLGGTGDLERMAAIRDAVPQSRLIVDANEAWTADMLPDYLAAMAALGVDMIEQPLPASADDALAGLERKVPICADESFHVTADLAGLADRYDLVNIKLDKTGGLTEALRAARTAADAGFGLMIGCMIGTSLAMAPAVLLTPLARFVDLDGPLLLAEDRKPGLRYDGSLMHPPSRQLWG